MLEINFESIIIKSVIDVTEKYIREKLFALQDSEYRDFHSKLMPTVKKELIFGVRTSVLR